MTLQQWSDKTGIKINRTHSRGQGNIVYILIDQFDDNRVELFHLSDYIASSVGGTVIWFTPRPVPYIGDKITASNIDEKRYLKQKYRDDVPEGK